METPLFAARRDRRPSFPALQLAVVGTDIREDSCRYSVFIIEVRFGRLTWTVEKRFNDFCALDALLRQRLTPQQAAALAPLPRKVPEFAIDNAVRVQRLDVYCQTLCVQVSDDRSAGAEDADVTQLVSLVYDFINLKKHCGQVKGPTTGVQDTVDAKTDLDWKALPDHSQVATAYGRQGDDYTEHELLLATESELSKLMEELSDADHRSQAHAETKKSLAQQVVAAQAEIPPLVARVQVGELQLQEAKDGAGASGQLALELCSLARQLDIAALTLVDAVRRWQTVARASTAPPALSLHTAAAQVHRADEHHNRDAFSNGVSGVGKDASGSEGESGAGRDGAGGAKREGSTGWGEEASGVQQDKRAGVDAGAQALTAAVAGAMQEFLHVEEACARIAAGPASVLPGGGTARGRMLLSVQTAQMLAENAALWRGLAESAETQRRVGAYLARHALSEASTAENGEDKSGGSVGGSPSSGEKPGRREGGGAEAAGAAQMHAARRGMAVTVSTSPRTGSVSDRSSEKSKQSSDDGTMSPKYRRQKIKELSDMLSAAYRTPSATSTASTPPPPSRNSSGGMHAGAKGGMAPQISDPDPPPTQDDEEILQEDGVGVGVGNLAEAAATTSGLCSKPPSTAVENAEAEAALTNTEAEAALTSGAQTGAVVEGGKDGEMLPWQKKQQTQAHMQAEVRERSANGLDSQRRNLDDGDAGLVTAHTAATVGRESWGGGVEGEGKMACSLCGTLGENLKRCGKCKNAWYCDKSCQAAAWLAGHREACAEMLTPLQTRQKGIPVHHSAAAAPALPHPTEDTNDTKKGASALEGAVSSKVSSAVAGSGESPAMEQAGRGGEGEGAVPRDGAERDAQLTSGGRDRPEKQEIIPKDDPCKMPRNLSGDPHLLGDNLLFKISGDPHLLQTPDSALGGGTGVSAQKGNSARIKGFSLTSPPPGFDDPDPVCVLDFAEEYQFPRPHSQEEQAVSKRGARGGVTKAEPSGYDDPDLVPSSPHPPAESLECPTAAAESGYDDPDLVISRPSGGAANARVACGEAQTPTPMTARYDAHAWPPDEYQGARADALPMVEEASTVLESHFCKLAETLAQERAALEKDRAAHRSLQQALRSVQARLVQAKRERDEAEAAAAQQAEGKTAISQRVALLEASIRTS